MSRKLIRKTKNIASRTLAIGLTLALTSSLIFGATSKSDFKEVRIPATWYPVTTDGKDFKVIDGVNPITVYHGKDLQNPETATFNNETNKFEINIASRKDLALKDSPDANGYMDLSRTGSLFFTDKYKHVVYQADGLQFLKTAKEKGINKENPDDKFFSSIVEAKYGNQQLLSAFSSHYKTLTGIDGSKTLSYDKDAAMDLYVRAHKQELMKSIPAYEGKDIYISINKDLMTAERNKQVKEQISKSIDRIEHYLPRDVEKFYLDQATNNFEGSYESFDTYKDKIKHTIYNKDLDKYKDAEGDKSKNIEAENFTELPFWIFDNTDDKFIADEKGKEIEPFAPDRNVYFNFLHSYELVCPVHCDEESQIVKWDDENKVYGNETSATQPRMLYPYVSTFHFPVTLYQSASPSVEVIWNDGGYSDKRPKSLDLSLKVATGEGTDKNLPSSFNVTRKLTFDDLTGTDLVKQFGEVPLKCIDKTKKNEFVILNYSFEAPDVSGYNKLVVGSPADGYVVTYNATGTVSFDANGGSFSKEVTPVTVEFDQALGSAFPAVKPVKEGHEFVGWATEKDAVKADFTKDTKVRKDMKVFAVWAKEGQVSPGSDVSNGSGQQNEGDFPSTLPNVKLHQISYDLNGGTLHGQSGVIQVDAKEGDTITIPQAPTRNGYKFLYWKGSKFYPGDNFVVTAPHTFTAQWEKIEPLKDKDKSSMPKVDDSKDRRTGKGNHKRPSTGDTGDAKTGLTLALLSLSTIVLVRIRLQLE